MDQSTIPSPPRFTLLLVEDDDVDAKALERAFRREKIAISIVRAMDGIEALDVLKGRNSKTKPPSPCILLVHLNMPRRGKRISEL